MFERRDGLESRMRENKIFYSWIGGVCFGMLAVMMFGRGWSDLDCGPLIRWTTPWMWDFSCGVFGSEGFKEKRVEDSSWSGWVIPPLTNSLRRDILPLQRSSSTNAFHKEMYLYPTVFISDFVAFFIPSPNLYFLFFLASLILTIPGMYPILCFCYILNDYGLKWTKINNRENNSMEEKKGKVILL